MIFKKSHTDNKIDLDSIQVMKYSDELKNYDFIFNESICDVNSDVVSTESTIKLIETMCEMIRKEIVWDYAFNKFGKENDGKEPISKLNNSNRLPSNKSKINLHNKLFLVNAWHPIKYLYYHIVEYTLDFINHDLYDYHFYNNLNIGYVGSGGNHRMLLQMIQNNNIDAYVNVIDDTDLLLNHYTDGVYVYDFNNNKTHRISDYRMAILFTLTKRKIELLNKTNDKM